MDKSNKKYTYEEFLEIIKTLRGENGCPWDRVQTHESLKPCMTEEAAELLASIRIYEKTGNPENMIEELGDVLLQVVLHAQIASEEGLFTMADVVDEVSRKMVRRHPHVFGTGNADTPEEVLTNWEEIKKEEKKDKEWVKSPLREIPQELPALTRAAKVLKKVDKLYEPGRDYAACVDALEKAAAALRQSSLDDGEQIAEQMGDALVALADISRICKLSPEQILTDRTEDIIACFDNKF